MSKHPTKREEARLMALTDQLEYLFAVNNYDRSFVWKQQDTPELVGADVTISIPYQRITICVYPVFWTHTLREQREMILHEFCHTIIQPIQNVATDLFEGKFRTEKERIDAVEHATSRVAQLLDAQLRGKNRYARIAYEKYLKK